MSRRRARARAGRRRQGARAAGQQGARAAGRASGWARERLGARAAGSPGVRGARAEGRGRPGRAGWPWLCTWCTRPVFGPV